MKIEARIAILTLSILLLCSALYSAYDYVYDRGYAAKTAEVNEYQARQAKELAKLSKNLAEVPKKVADDAAVANASILLSIKNRPLYFIDKSGNCQPSKDFDKAYRELLK